MTTSDQNSLIRPASCRTRVSKQTGSLRWRIQWSRGSAGSILQGRIRPAVIKADTRRIMVSQSRRELLKSIAAASAIQTLQRVGAAQQVKTRRNVIFILTDDHRYDALGFMHPQTWLKTPNLDLLARQGAQLKNASVTTAPCSPSRASILTGVYAHRHGIVDNNTAIPRGTQFFPELLRAAGYKTAFIGKWHMGNSGDEPQPGFD